jgi:hypothetical protein
VPARRGRPRPSAVDTIGHRTIYRDAIAGGEALVHQITIGCGVGSVVLLVAAYTHRVAAIPAAVASATRRGETPGDISLVGPARTLGRYQAKTFKSSITVDATAPMLQRGDLQAEVAAENREAPEALGPVRPRGGERGCMRCTLLHRPSLTGSLISRGFLGDRATRPKPTICSSRPRGRHSSTCR